jgi:hypothetical protein
MQSESQTLEKVSTLLTVEDLISAIAAELGKSTSSVE